jgi:hypothetical protein
MPAQNFRLAEIETGCVCPQRELGVQVMSNAILSEVREITLTMAMLAGLLALSLGVACAAVVIADNQTRHVATLAGVAPVALLEP